MVGSRGEVSGQHAWDVSEIDGLHLKSDILITVTGKVVSKISIFKIDMKINR